MYKGLTAVGQGSELWRNIKFDRIYYAEFANAIWISNRKAKRYKRMLEPIFEVMEIDPNALVAMIISFIDAMDAGEEEIWDKLWYDIDM